MLLSCAHTPFLEHPFDPYCRRWFIQDHVFNFNHIISRGSVFEVNPSIEPIGVRALSDVNHGWISGRRMNLGGSTGSMKKIQLTSKHIQNPSGLENIGILTSKLHINSACPFAMG